MGRSGEEENDDAIETERMVGLSSVLAPRDESDDEGSLFEEEGEEDADQGDFIREKDTEMTGDGRDVTTTTGPRGEGTKQNDNDDKMMMDDDDHEGDIEYDSDEEEQEHWDGDLQGDISSDDDEKLLKIYSKRLKTARNARDYERWKMKISTSGRSRVPGRRQARQVFAAYKGLEIVSNFSVGPERIYRSTRGYLRWRAISDSETFERVFGNGYGFRRRFRTYD